MAKHLPIETLQQLIWDLSAEVESLKKKVQRYERRIEALEKENLMLKEKLAKYENPKNSNNSSIPPSKDENRPFKSKSLRKKTGRKPGGQKGHEGTTLEMVSNPDKIIDHMPAYCKCCGKDIGSVPGELVDKKQVIDLPPIQPVVTEHRVNKKICTCGHITISSFPGGIQAPVSYGPMI